MSQNGKTHFKNLAANAASVSDHFGTLCIKGLKNILSCYYKHQNRVSQIKSSSIRRSILFLEKKTIEEVHSIAKRKEISYCTGRLFLLVISTSFCKSFPAKIYFFEVNKRNIQKGVKYVQISP